MSLPPPPPIAATALPALCDALNLLMLGSDTAAALEAQVQLLRQLKPALVGPSLQAEVSRTEGVLADVLLQRKQAAEAQQGSKTARCARVRNSLGASAGSSGLSSTPPVLP
jgi:dihydroxyacetone kinase